ncbi:hypothetical protein V8C35DRAFT_319145 [Trichoderma chlorosporum]
MAVPKHLEIVSDKRVAAVLRQVEEKYPMVGASLVPVFSQDNYAQRMVIWSFGEGQCPKEWRPTSLVRELTNFLKKARALSSMKKASCVNLETEYHDGDDDGDDDDNNERRCRLP